MLRRPWAETAHSEALARSEHKTSPAAKWPRTDPRADGRGGVVNTPEGVQSPVMAEKFQPPVAVASGYEGFQWAEVRRGP